MRSPPALTFAGSRVRDAVVMFGSLGERYRWAVPTLLNLQYGITFSPQFCIKPSSCSTPISLYCCIFSMQWILIPTALGIEDGILVATELARNAVSITRERWYMRSRGSLGVFSVPLRSTLNYKKTFDGPT